MNANLKNMLQQTPANFLYVFIPDAAVSDFQGYPRILNKRAEQIKWLRANNMTDAGYEESKNIIGAAFQAEYNMTPGQAILYICSGESHLVKGKNGVINIAGVGANTAITAKGIPTTATINPKDPSEAVDANGDYICGVVNTQTGKLEGWFNNTTGQQVSYWDGTNWKPGTDNKKDVWSKVMNVSDLIMKVIEFFVGLFTGVKKAKDISAMQNDDPNMFVAPLQNKDGKSIISIELILLLGGVALLSYFLLRSNNKSQKAST